MDEKETNWDQITYDYNTVHNVDIRGCELAPTFRTAMKYWNSSVQYWLATHIYRNSPKHYRSVSSEITVGFMCAVCFCFRMALTMLVSAFWHGVHLGYYLSFLTIPLCTATEDLVFKVVKGKQTEEELKRDGRNDVLKVFSFDFAWWFFRVRGFEYMSMGFLLLSFKSTMRYWSSIYFAVHAVLILLLVGFLLVVKVRTNKLKSQ